MAYICLVLANTFPISASLVIAPLTYSQVYVIVSSYFKKHHLWKCMLTNVKTNLKTQRFTET